MTLDPMIMLRAMIKLPAPWPISQVPLKAFVDTGAQVTVLSVKGAQKCNLLDKVDSRFRGVAAGVGAARIVGRVHLATLRFSAHTAVDTSLSVLEQSHGPEVDASPLDAPPSLRGVAPLRSSRWEIQPAAPPYSNVLFDSLLLTSRLQLLIGLDLMRKYQAVIDLGRNAMLIGGKAIPFVEGDDKKRH